MKLDGSISAVVTGGASGLGEGTARALAAQGRADEARAAAARGAEALADALGPEHSATRAAVALARR